MSDERLHPCARCAQAQRTCCQRAEIVLTLGDRQRIESHCGSAGFSERRPPADPGLLEFDPDDPNWVRWTVGADGARRVLKRRPDGDCTFLGAAGCTLPGEVRPLVCRLYPFTYTENALTGDDPAYCPTTLLDPGRIGMLKILDMNAAGAERWRRQLYDELRRDAESEGSETA